ncbi:MAG: thioredoxin family protein [Armatimonadetes bacterium]|nr:thioredoxin family protein [Armatimonadota bacterium]
MVRKSIVSSLAVGAVVLSATALTGIAAPPQPAAPGTMVAAIGKPAPNFTLTSPQGQTLSVDTQRKGERAKATVVMFVATQCPVSNAYNERMVKLAQEYSPKDVRFIGINSNKQESIEEVAKHAKEHNFPFPVLIDVGNVIADRYNAQVTPQVYVIDQQGILRYMGRIDNSQDVIGIKSQDLRAALDAVLAGRTPPATETRAFGCSIKRMEKGS